MSIYEKNRRLNEEEIAAEKIVLESKLCGLGVALTSRCGLRCIMCSAWESAWDIPAKAINEISGYMPYLGRLYWQGGEVFLSEHFEKLFDKAVQQPQLKQEIVTSGILIDRRWAEKFREANLNLIFSIEGMKPATYEYIRKGAMYSDMLKSVRVISEEKGRISTVKAAGLKTSINFTVMGSNYREIESIPEFAAEHGFDDITLTPVDYITSDENIFAGKDIEALRIISNSVKIIEEKALQHGISFHNWLPRIEEGPGKDPTGGQTGMPDRKILCLWPWQHLFIDIGGAVKPHCLCPRAAGKIEDNTLEEIWNNEVMTEYRQKILDKSLESICNRNCIENIGQEDLFRIGYQENR